MSGCRGPRAHALALVVALLAAAAPRPVAADEVVVFAAASLSDALEEIGRVYAARAPDRMRVSAGASNDLARQILAGAPADVFFSADPRRMDELERAGLVAPGSRRDVLSNGLVVVVPRASPLQIAGAHDLAAVDRLALADPEGVPAGMYARRWLEGRGVWSALAGRVVPALDVRAALAAVAAGHADAGIVYRTDAAIEPRVRVALAVPRDEAPAIVYVLAALAHARTPAAAHAATFLAGPEARTVYERYGFVVLAP